MELKKLYIGVDPDVDSSGVATWDGGNLFVDKKTFFELYDYLINMNDVVSTGKKYNDLEVIIEAGWLNKKSNWHTEGKGEFIAGRIGTKVGANHEVGKKIAEMCEYIGIKYKLIQPQTQKFGARQFRMLTKYKGKIDQDMIDAVMLVYGL